MCRNRVMLCIFVSEMAAKGLSKSGAEEVSQPETVRQQPGRGGGSSDGRHRGQVCPGDH